MKKAKIKVWNKGLTVGQKKPLTPKQVRMIKDGLLINPDGKKKRDLALFSTAIDTMLRSVDLLSLTVENVRESSTGKIKDRFWVMQQKTKSRHFVEIASSTQKALYDWIVFSKKFDDEYLFTGKKNRFTPLSRVMYSLLVKKWISTYAHINSDDYSTHSLRRTKASIIYRKTNNIEVVRQLLGQKSVDSTSHYLNIAKEDALDIAKELIPDF